MTCTTTFPRLLALAGLLCVLVLTGCGDKENKIGSTTKGIRIALLDNSKTLSADKELEGQKPQVESVTLNGSWIQAGYDPTHVLPNAQIADVPQKIWSSSIGDGSGSDFKLLARPVIADGRVVTMDAQGLVTSFDTKTGNRIWEFDTTPKGREEKAIGGGVGIDGSVVYATTGFGEVLALQASDGKVLWRHMLLNPVRSAPTIEGGRVYVVSIDNEMQALDTRTGQPLWHHNGIAESATLMGASSPAVYNDNVVVAYSSGEIYSLRAENGRSSWNYGLTTPTQVGALPAIADIHGLPVIDRGRVFAISHSGRMAAIDLRTGDRVWENDIGGTNTPLISGSTIFILTNDGQLLALSRDSGRIIWVQELQHFEDPKDKDTDPVYWTGPVLAGGRLWLTNSLGQLASFSVANGVQLKQIDIGAPSYIPPVIAGGTIYVVTDDGSVVALR